MRARKGKCMTDRNDPETTEDVFEHLLQLRSKLVRRCSLQVDADGTFSLGAWLTETSGRRFIIPFECMVADFNKIHSLRELRDRYFVSRKALWRALEHLKLDPWERVIADYKASKSLEEVAATHGMKTTTISRGLKDRGIPRRQGRIPIELDANEVDIALRDEPSINELCRRLEIKSWTKANDIKKKARGEWG